MKKRMDAKAHALLALLVSFVIAGFWFIVVYQRIAIIYDINDDVAMRNVAAGVITGAPDAHLLHIKYLLGLVISGLYSCFPGFDWYGLVMIGMILCAFAVILYRGLAAEKRWIWKTIYTILAVLLFTILGLPHVAAFQWTTAAAIVGSAGVYLFYTSDTKDYWLQIFEEGCAVCLILLTLAIRDDVFLMVLPVAGLCFWWKYGTLVRTDKGIWKAGLRHWGVPVALVLGVLLLLGVETIAYRSPEWKEFRKYNIDREAIMDFYGLQNYEEDPAFFDSLGFTPEETENIQRYSLYLVDDLYSENMEKLAEHSKEVYLETHSVGKRFKEAVSEIYTHLGKNTYYLTNTITLFLIALTIGACVGKERKQLGLVLAVLAFWGMYWLYLGYRDRILERVGFALYLLAALTMLAVWYRARYLQSIDGEQTSVFGKVLALGACVVLVLTAGMTWKTVQQTTAERSNYNLQFLDVNEYMAEHPENVYFMTTFSIETYTDNFTVRRDFAFSNLLSVGGWHTFSPLENAKNEKLGITNPKQDIAEKENVYLISLENVNLRYLDRYYTSVYETGYQGREKIDSLDYGTQVFEVYDFAAKAAE